MDSAARTSGWGGGRGARDGRRAAIEQAVVHVSIADDCEVLSEPRFAHHARSVSAHEHGFVLFEPVMVI